MGFTQPSMSAATPAPEINLPKPPEARPPAQEAGPRPKRRSMQTTFLGSQSTPQAPTNMGGKTLLGQ